MKKVTAISGLIITLGLSGCAIMSESECSGADGYSRWTKIGQDDGSEGKAPQIEQRGQACAKHNVMIDRDAYVTGYKKGIMAYCQPQNILNLALQGKGNGQGSWFMKNGGSYTNCPLEIQDELRPYYNVGSNYYQAKTNLDGLEQDIANARSALQQSNLKPKQRDSYNGEISRDSQLLPSARSSFEEAKRDLIQFKNQNGLY